MRIIICFLCLVCVQADLSFGQDDTAENPDEIYEWPMIAGNPGRTGYVPDDRVKPPFRLKWATQPGCGTSMEVCVANGRVYTPSCCLDAETGEVLWKANLGGCVPSYHKGRIYSGGSRITAYDAASGKRLWTKHGYSVSGRGKRHGMTVYDGMIYAGKRANHNGSAFYFMDALDAETGDLKWSTPLIAVVKTKRKGYHLGMTMGSPAAAGGIVVTTTHSPRYAFGLYAATGKELWRQKDMCVWNALATDGKTAWAAERMQGVWALDARTGEKLWKWGGKTGDLIKANYALLGTAKYPPVSAYGKVFVQNYGRRYTALESKTGKELWIAGDKGGHGWAGTCGPPCAAGGYIFTNGTVGKDFNGKQYRFVVAAVDHRTGRPVWRNPISGKACARVPIAYARIYPVGGTEIYCFEPVPADYRYEPQPQPEKPAAPPEPLAQPFGGEPGTPEAGGKPEGGNDWPMYGGCPARCGLEITIGLPIKEAWKFQTGGKVKSSPVIADGLVFAGSDSGKLYALEVKTGKEKWSAEITPPENCRIEVKWIRSGPAVGGGTVVCGADDGVMRAFDAETGKPKWQFRTAGRIRSSAAIVKGRAAPDKAKASSSVERRVVFGSWDGHCYCIRLSDGKEFWRWRVGDPGIRLYAPPAVACGRVYIGAWEDRKVHGLDLGTGKPLDGYEARSGYGTKVGLVQGITIYRGLIVTCRDRHGCHLINPVTGRNVLKNARAALGLGTSLVPGLPSFSGEKVFHPQSPLGIRLSDVLSPSKPGTGRKKKRRSTFKHPVFNGTLVAGNLIIAATSAGTLDVRRLPGPESDGPAEPVWEWKSESGAEIHTAPAAADGFIVIGSDDGNIYGFSYTRED